MKTSTSLIKFVSAFAIAGTIFISDAMAEKIIWVAGTYKGADSLITDQPFIDMLVSHGYQVQVERETMKGNPLTAEQLAVLESADLIIVSRATSSGDYIDPAGWNSISKPLILNNVYLARQGRWFWANTDNLEGSGDSGSPVFSADEPTHPIFTGVTIDADGSVAVLDTTVGTGNTSLISCLDFGDGQLIASSMRTLSETIVYWETGASFTSGSTYPAGGSRMLFTCQTREGGTFGVGMYNLTPQGEKMYLNAVAFMLGKSTAVSEKAGTLPAGYELAQNFPNPFNPSTRIAFTLLSPSMTKISVHNLLGQEISVLAEETFQAGNHEVVWNGRDRFGDLQPGGVYLYQMKTRGSVQVKKMLMLK
jgi:hypothetical protein